MTLEEARHILAAQDSSDTAKALEAAAVIIRFHGIADKALLPIAEIIEDVVNSLSAENARILALLARVVAPLEWYADYLNDVPVRHCTGHEANTIDPLVAELRAATAPRAESAPPL